MPIGAGIGDSRDSEYVVPVRASKSPPFSVFLLSLLSLFCGPHTLKQWDRMVQLTMTPAIVAAIEAFHKISPILLSLEAHATDPSLEDPRVGNPISHGQIIAISRCLRKHRNSPGEPHMTAAEPASYRLDDLLRGSKVYIVPSKPKAEPVRSPAADTDLVLTWLSTVIQIQSIDGTSPSGRGSTNI